MEDFLKALEKDPKLIGRLQKSGALAEFKEKYRVERASLLKCPFCAAFEQSPGTLWGPKEGTTDEFVCKKCRLEWKVNCITKSNQDVMSQLREILKGPRDES